MSNRALCVVVLVAGVGALVLSESARAQNEMLFAAEQLGWGGTGTPIAIDDVDLDGRLDIVTHGMFCDTETWECVFGVYVRLGRPDRSFSEPQFHQAGTTVNQWPNPIFDLFIRDVNADGWPDIVYLDSSRREVIALPAVGAGAFGAAVISSCAGPNQAVSGLDLGDVDGDGVVDAVVSLYTGAQGCQCVRILRGSGTGSFSALTSVTMGPSMDSLRMRDLNGDGLLDLVALVDNGDVVTRLGLGGAQFADPVTTVMPFVLAEISLADLDADGLLDIVAPSYAYAAAEDDYIAMVSLLRNVGGGAFGSLMDITLTHFTLYELLGLSLAVADMNGDGAADVLMAAPQVESGPRSASLSDDAVYVLEGRGGFAFADPVKLAFAGAASSLAPTDLDADGVLDLVYVASIYGFQPTVGIRYGRREGGFESEAAVPVGSPTVDLASGDANLDGHIDIALAHEAGADQALSLQLGAGDGSFSAGQPIAFQAAAHRVLLTDVSSDAWPDLVTASSAAGATIQVHLGLGNGTFDAPVAVSTEPAADLEATDLNQDGLVDLLSCDPASQRVFVHLGLGGGAFAPPIGYSAGGACQRLAVGDLDEDGDLDVLVASPDPTSTSVLQTTLATLQNLGGAQLGLPTLHEIIGAQDVAVADWDRDGHLDAILAIYARIPEDPYILIYIGTQVCAGLGDGTLGEPVYVAQPVVPWRVETADLNRDGWLDVVASPAPLEMVGDDAGFGPLRCIGIGLGQSDPFPRREIAVEGLAQPVATTVADFNEDGFPDIAAADLSSDSISVMLNRSGTWANLGCDLAPIEGGGVPLLVGTGRPFPDEAISLESTSSMLGRGSPGVLVVGVDTAYTPFHGGFLVPSISISAPIQTEVPLIGRWPKGIPAGTPVYLQALFAPASGDVVATNALVVIAQ